MTKISQKTRISETEKTQTTPKHNAKVLREKIAYLEEELVRKDKIIEKLREENTILLKTALKNSEKRM